MNTTSRTRPSAFALSHAQRASRPPGMPFARELLVALIMAVAMLATLSLYR